MPRLKSVRVTLLLNDEEIAFCKALDRNNDHPELDDFRAYLGSMTVVELRRRMANPQWQRIAAENLCPVTHGGDDDAHSFPGK